MKMTKEEKKFFIKELFLIILLEIIRKWWNLQIYKAWKKIILIPQKENRKKENKSDKNRIEEEKNIRCYLKMIEK